LKYRHRVLALSCVLLTILMLDRVCISVAGPRMQAALHIGPVGWGWVNGMFALAFAMFEIPSGILGDRIGPRRVLTRVVLWWSAFTALTGAVFSLPVLLIVRFLFGAGEAGGYPNVSVVIARWFPVRERGLAFGFVLMAAQVGGALSPLIVVPIQMHYGWRGTFWFLGLLGPLWATIWYFWYRDTPGEKLGVSAAELAETAEVRSLPSHTMPWAIALRTGNIWAAAAICFCYIYTYVFFASWFHTYLVKARGFNEKDLWLSSLPYAVAAAANLLGGFVSNILVQRCGLRWGRCAIGFFGLATAGLAIVGVMFAQGPGTTLALLALANGAITFQQPIMFAVCLDIGGACSGAMVGVMNTASGIASFVGAIAFGYIVSRTGGYTMPFVPMALLLFIGAMLWLYIDPREQLQSQQRTDPEVAALA
jgi:ACS family glucarate transporter-like MFS transporter